MNTDNSTQGERERERESAHLDECFLGESLVDLRSVGDVLGPVGIVQRGEGLLDVAHGGADRGNDGGLGPSSQRVLQDPRQLALTGHTGTPTYMHACSEQNGF